MLTIFKKLRSIPKRNSPIDQPTANVLLDEEDPIELSVSLEKNEEQFNQIFDRNFDYFQERVFVGREEGLILYLKSMVDGDKVSEHIMETLSVAYGQKRRITTDLELKEFQREYFASHDLEFVQFEHEVVWYTLSGYTVILVEGLTKGLAINTTTSENRAIEQSQTQTIIRGPKDSFTESLSTNISLIRRRIKNAHLKSEKIIVGKETHTSVCITYLENTANLKIVDEVRKRINEINIKAIFDSGNIEELISDKVITPFPLIYHTDRPDTTATNIVDGKVTVFVDGSPFVLIMPVVLTDFFKVSEDYYQGFLMSTFIRLIRYLAFLLALILPSLYIGLTTFQHQLIPTGLVFTLQAQREGVPFPAAVEIMLMEITFEILREAGVRMPRAVGQAVSIVGTLVIGQAAVEAGIVSNFLVIVVALTAMAGFVSPIYSFANSARILRFGLIIITSAFGLYGTLIGIIIIIAHLASLRSFGIPYLAPVAPLIIEDQADVFVRLPIWEMKGRPTYFSSSDSPKREGLLRNPSNKEGENQ